MKEISELITKLTEAQIKEIANTWQKAKEIMEKLEAEKNREEKTSPPKSERGFTL